MWLTFASQIPNARSSNFAQSHVKIGSQDERPAMTSKVPSVRSSSDSNSLPEGYKADPKQGAMLRYQASLPHLPVPPLASTLAKYLETIRPHLTPSEYARSESVVRAFGASAQAGELQRRLEARAVTAAEPGGMANWLADWWNETAYMAYRDPVVVNVSYFYVHVADAAVRDAPRRAATLLKAMLPFRTLVETCVKLSKKGSFVLPYVLIPHAIVVSVLGWNLRRSAGRLSAWIRTSGCECICTFTMTGDETPISLPCPDSMPVDIPLSLRTLPTNFIRQRTTTWSSFETTGSSRSSSHIPTEL